MDPHRNVRLPLQEPTLKCQLTPSWIRTEMAAYHHTVPEMTNYYYMLYEQHFSLVDKRIFNCYNLAIKI